MPPLQSIFSWTHFNVQLIEVLNTSDFRSKSLTKHLFHRKIAFSVYGQPSWTPS